MSSVTVGGLWSRLVTGDGLQKTRLHTYSGNLIDLGGLRYLPHSVWSVLLLKLFGYCQRVPWLRLGYRGVGRLRSLIRPDWTILELGSGMSSVLFAQLCSTTLLNPQLDRPERLDALHVVRPLGEEVRREDLLYDGVRRRKGEGELILVET